MKANRTPKFTSLGNANAEDWAEIAREFVPFAAELPDRVLAHLKMLEGDMGGACPLTA